MWMMIPHCRRMTSLPAAGAVSYPAGLRHCGDPSTGGNFSRRPTGQPRAVRQSCFLAFQQPLEPLRLVEEFQPQLPPTTLSCCGILVSPIRNTPANYKHKHSSIVRILNTYPELPFILIGDSGEKDAYLLYRGSGVSGAHCCLLYIRVMCALVLPRSPHCPVH